MKCRFRLLMGAMLVIAMLALGGCGSDSKSAGGKIVFSSHDANDGFPSMIYDAVLERAQKAGIEVELLNAKGDINEQVDQLNAAIDQKPNAIVLLPVEGTGIVPTVQKINKAGIPVIQTNRDLNGGEFAGVMSDERQAGQLQGEFMAKNLPQGAKIVYLMGEPNLSSSKDRWEGFKEACLDKRPDITLLAKAECDWSEAQGLRYMTMWLEVFPQIDAVVSANDTMAIGAIKAMKAAGRNNGVLVCGCDGLKVGLDAVASGDMALTVQQNADKTADAIMDLVQKAISGNPSTDKVKVPYTEITSANVAQFRQ